MYSENFIKKIKILRKFKNFLNEVGLDGQDGEMLYEELKRILNTELNKLFEELYCPHCDEFHEDKDLIIDIPRDYIKCKFTNEEIKTYKFIDSISTKLWRKNHGLD